MKREGYPQEVEEAMRKHYGSLSEKDRRRYAAVEAMKLERGGQTYICKVLGCDPATVKVGREEVLHGSSTPPERIRKAGGGRKKIEEKDPGLEQAFEEVMEENTAGSPMEEGIKWTNLGQKGIAQKLEKKGHRVSEKTVKKLLKRKRYGKRKLKKTKTIKQAEHRNDQFEKIAKLRAEYEKTENPILSMDVKKKENLGNLYRDGKVYSNKTREVLDHDFASLAEGVVIPHGLYDVKLNRGYMTLGTSKDTSEFACDCIRDWWYTYGKKLYPHASSILILADGGGSNSSRQYLFKEDLQKLSNELGIEIRIAHYPPYTSKFNPIEHRLFCHVTRACAGVVFSSVEVVKNLINTTSTAQGLTVVAHICDKVYATARKVADDFKKTITIVFDEFLGKWNYRAVPQTP